MHRRSLSPPSRAVEEEDLLVALAASLADLCLARQVNAAPAAAAAAQPEEEPGAAPAAPEWAYAVWRIDGQPQGRGVHVGSDRAWAAIVRLLPGQRYSSAVCRLRRCESLGAALALYRREATRHGAPLPAPIFHH